MMNNTIRNRPTSITPQDIQRMAQQGQDRALRARGFPTTPMGPMSYDDHMGRLAHSLIRSINHHGKPVRSEPTLAGGRPVNPDLIPQEQPLPEPVVAGGISVPPPPVTMGLVAAEPPVPVQLTPPVTPDQ